MLKGKNLWILAGVAVVGYYIWRSNKAKKDAAAAAATPASPNAAFTGSMGY